DAELIAKRIQLPIRALDPGLGSQADEDALAQSRLLTDEQFDPDAFHGVTELMNEAGAGVCGRGRARGAQRPVRRAAPVAICTGAADRARLATDARLRLPRPRGRARGRRHLRLPDRRPLPPLRPRAA